MFKYEEDGEFARMLFMKSILIADNEGLETTSLDSKMLSENSPYLKEY